MKWSLRPETGTGRVTIEEGGGQKDDGGRIGKAGKCGEPWTRVDELSSQRWGVIRTGTKSLDRRKID
jgi:hypothetical protein